VVVAAIQAAAAAALAAAPLPLDRSMQSRLSLHARTPRPAPPGSHRLPAKATLRDDAGGAAAVAVVVAVAVAPAVTAAAMPVPPAPPLHKVGHAVNRREVAGVLRRLLGVRTAHRAQPADTEVAGGIEHR
jgi:hypothetical protein